MFDDISDRNSLFELSVTSMWNPVAMFKILILAETQIYMYYYMHGGKFCLQFRFVTLMKFSQH